MKLKLKKVVWNDIDQLSGDSGYKSCSKVNTQLTDFGNLDQILIPASILEPPLIQEPPIFCLQHQLRDS